MPNRNHLQGERRYSWGPIDCYLANRWPQVGDQRLVSLNFDSEMARPQAHVILGLGRHQYIRWRKSDLDDRRADLLATRLGLSPVEFWPNWYDDAMEDV